jgi:1-acyl-sn-glycerol-3-phosphate acyltransferase
MNVATRSAFAFGPRSAGANIGLAIVRSLAFVFFSFVALAEILLLAPLIRGSRQGAVRAAWLHYWCRFACRVLGVNFNVRGAVPVSGLLVCNHLSYIDIIVLSSVAPCVFVAKRDVSTWPLFGWLARAAGTIFADRNRKTASLEAVEQIQNAIKRGALVVLFPEGTSSDGRTVLPFKSALMEPALQSDCDLFAAAIDYALPHGGSVGDEVCYWRDMTLAPHLVNLFSKREINSRLVVAPAGCSGGNRKELARALRQQVIELRS